MSQKRPREDQHVTGRVKRLMLDRKPAFGFIVPSNGGNDIYFNEYSIGVGTSWDKLVENVQQCKSGEAPVIFKHFEGRDGKWHVSGALSLGEDLFKELDIDGDGYVSSDEMEKFLAKHPEIVTATKSQAEAKHDKETAEMEAKSKARGEITKRLDEATEALYKQRDAENQKAHDLREEANKLWDAGEHDKCKALQAEAKEHSQKAQEIKREASDLEWKNSEEIFNFVQTKENGERTQDGTWIDLHGLTGDFAEHKTREFLLAAQAKGVGKVEVVTGFGHHSGPEGPAIKRHITSLFHHPPDALKGMSFEKFTNDAGFYVNLV